MNKDFDFSQDYSSDSLANARWADPAYIADKYVYKPGAIWLGRNPHNPDEAIGYKDDRHVFVCAETRSGKGRSLLVNNQVLWPGSLVTVGPKGEEASIAAIRRGSGNKHCEGMGQKVYVLDPMRCADVPKELRAHFNLLSGLDINDGEIVSKADRIANAICTIPENGGDTVDWAKRGRELVATLILHVKTFPHFEKEERNILTVRNLVQQGQVKGAQILKEIKDIDINPFEVLLFDMVENKACRGVISRRARELFESFKDHPKLFQSIRGSAADHLRFLEGEGICNTVFFDGEDQEHDLYPRTFDINELRNNEKGISVFICLPEQDYEPLSRWLRAMIVLIFDHMRGKQGTPATGYPVLFTIDEFANLGKSEDISSAVNSIAGSGIKLMIAVQRLGDLQELYGKAWEKFVSAAGAQIWFGLEEMATREHIEKALGKTEVSKIARSVGINSSHAVAEGISESYSHTHSQSSSETHGTSTSKAKGSSEAHSRNKSKSKGKNTNYGSSNGTSAGHNYGPHLFFQGFAHGTNYSSNKGHSSGGGTSEQTTDSDGYTDTKTFTETIGDSHSTTGQTGESSTHQKGTSYMDTQTEGDNAGLAETFHVKPLLSALEAKQYLLTPPELDHPAFPGLALITLANEENPFFVRRANHDQDPEFISKFNPNPAFKFIPYDQQPLLGWQITPEYFFTLKMPNSLKGNKNIDVQIPVSFKPNAYVKTGEPFINIDLRASLHPAKQYKSTFDFKVIAKASPEERIETREIVTIRANFPINEDRRKKINRNLWSSTLKFLRDKKEKEDLIRQRKKNVEKEEKIQLEAFKIKREKILTAQTEAVDSKIFKNCILGVFCMPLMSTLSIQFDFIELLLMIFPIWCFLIIDSKKTTKKIEQSYQDEIDNLKNSYSQLRYKKID